jgi:hypothetical protein
MCVRDFQREAKMRVAICGELDQWNKNVDEMIRLFQSTQNAGVWTRQEAERHEARLEALRVELNDDFNALVALRERVALLGFSERSRGS